MRFKAWSSGEDTTIFTVMMKVLAAGEVDVAQTAIASHLRTEKMSPIMKG